MFSNKMGTPKDVIENDEAIRVYKVYLEFTRNIDLGLKHRSVKDVAKGMNLLPELIELIEEVYGIDFEHCMTCEGSDEILTMSGYQPLPPIKKPEDWSPSADDQ